MTKWLTTTKNSENALNITGDKCIDLYTKFVDAWSEDPETCIKAATVVNYIGKN